MKLVQEFKAFILRGNVIDLAVAIIIGVAFTTLVTAFVEDMITPLIAAIGGRQDFSSLHFTINDSVFLYGDFLNALISFLMIALVVFLFVVTPINELLRRSRKEPPADPTTKKCPECLTEVPIEARRCFACTTVLASA
jgi:large conductance mechanosensitive channel